MTDIHDDHDHSITDDAPTDAPLFEAVTQDITVQVRPVYLEDVPEVPDDKFAWAYMVRIINGSKTLIQVRSRHWQIIDANGHTEVVEGDGLVGEQPVLPPGTEHQYQSFCVLDTSSGMMLGEYGVEDGTGSAFRIDIPAFSLDSAQAKIGDYLN